jgi:D-glycero-D-manno-heptose 1,7-bisphosphate phosphatase
VFFKLHTPRFDSPRPAVFLDRDGTLNVEKNYLYKREDWEWIDGARESIKRFSDAGYAVVVISNQAGIARGMYQPEDVDNLHQLVQEDLEKIGTKIDAFFYCPHHPDFGSSCECRKPSPMMLTEAAHLMNIRLKDSWMIGDRLIDVECGKNAGVHSILVKTGYGKSELPRMDQGCKAFDSVGFAGKYILNSKIEGS